MADTLELLDQPAPRAARIIALRLLEDTTRARQGLKNGPEGDSLHDFRVALRRLRSWLRSQRPQLEGSVPKKARRRLARAARATGKSRDAEVHLEWLRAQRGALTARQRRGLNWLVARVEAEKKEGDELVAAKATKSFDRASATLERKLPVYTVRIDREEPDPSFAPVMAEMIRGHARTLSEALSGIVEYEDDQRAHGARIAAKRLRYLLEPIADEIDGARALVKDLASFQDTLGDWHDVYTFSKSIVGASEQAGAAETRRVSALIVSGDEIRHALRAGSGRDVTLGLLALASRLRDRGQAAFAAAGKEWPIAGERFLERADRVARALESHQPSGRLPLVLVSGDRGE